MGFFEQGMFAGFRQERPAVVQKKISMLLDVAAPECGPHDVDFEKWLRI